jgi:hypothetical protein
VSHAELTLTVSSNHQTSKHLANHSDKNETIEYFNFIVRQCSYTGKFKSKETINFNNNSRKSEAEEENTFMVYLPKYQYMPGTRFQKLLKNHYCL